MASCIICHLEILSIEPSHGCPNEHPVHDTCLREWLGQSDKCPLCQEPYSKALLDQFKGYLKEKQQQKLQAIKEKDLEKTIEKIDIIAVKMLFLKYINFIEDLVEEKKYDIALDRLENMEDGNNQDYKSQMILFTKGKIHFLRGRYDLSINHLFKLVKVKYDYPDAFLYLAKSYEHLGLPDKAKWAYERVK